VSSLFTCRHAFLFYTLLNNPNLNDNLLHHESIPPGEKMSLLLKQIFNFLKLLNSDTETTPLAYGLALGLILGFAPFFSLQTFLVLMIVFVFRVQLGAAFLSAFFFKLIAFLFDYPAHLLGKSILEAELFRPAFTELYNLPIVPMTRFNNSIVMGSMIVSFILFPFAVIGFRKLIEAYRKTIISRFKNTKFWKAFTATKVYNWYAKYTELYG
jgi:uncharacterized protein (TIGR03546 family)